MSAPLSYTKVGLFLLSCALPIAEGCATSADEQVGSNAAALSETSQLITDWNAFAADNVAASTTSPPLHARHMAVVSVSVLDTVNAFDPVYRPYAVDATPPAGASLAAAALAAAHTALRSISAASRTAIIDDRYNADLATLSDDGKADGVAFGEAVANTIVALRAHDGSAGPIQTWTVVPGPGNWQPTPAGTPFALLHVKDQQPWVIDSNSQWRNDISGPYPLGSAEYAADYNEIKIRGVKDGSNRTADESNYALWWRDSAALIWNQAARQAITQNHLGTLDAAHVYGVLNLALADSGGPAWDAKAYFADWRPITAIRNGDIDGNDATVADPNWTPFTSTPGHPNYISAHTVFSAAATTALNELLAGKPVNLNLSSSQVSNTRHFDSFDAMLAEVNEARITAGIHTRKADADGTFVGRKVGNFVLNHAYKANPHHPHH
jgi:hypothetical protein